VEGVGLSVSRHSETIFFAKLKKTLKNMITSLDDPVLNLQYIKQVWQVGKEDSQRWEAE
jgi:hypothetical protein